MICSSDDRELGNASNECNGDFEQVNQGSVDNLHCVYAAFVAEQEIPSRYLTAEASFVKFRVQLDGSAAPATNLKR
jgi:hypothetical protein